MDVAAPLFEPVLSPLEGLAAPLTTLLDDVEAELQSISTSILA